MITYGEPVFALRNLQRVKKWLKRRRGIGPQPGLGVGQDPAAPGVAQPSLGAGWGKKWNQNWGG